MLSEHPLNDPGDFLTDSDSQICMHVLSLFQLTPKETINRIKKCTHSISLNTIDPGCLQVEQPKAPLY